MNQYKVIIKFNDGDEIQSKVAAKNQSAALARLMANEQVQEFAGSHDDVSSIDISYLGEYKAVSNEPGRFVLTPSQGRAGWWVAADRQTNMVFLFAGGAFLDSVEYKPLEDMPALDAATAVRELGDWLRIYHPELYEVWDEYAKSRNRKRLGAIISESRKKQGLTVRELAERSGVTSQNITKIENGKYNVSIDILDKICKALGLQIDLESH